MLVSNFFYCWSLYSGPNSIDCFCDVIVALWLYYHLPLWS
uniref:Uncharacterized protein n=1 Tax=Rhizophora mucronata TaxID=61149 RepID=A0A2P2QMF3_RHIMU